MLPHYLVKVETTKIHVNTSSPFNVAVAIKRPPTYFYT